VELKEYQIKVLGRLDGYLKELKTQKEEAEEYIEFQKSRGKHAALQDFCLKAWDELNNKRILPVIQDRHGRKHIAPYIRRFDGLERPIPNICLKVPTGGGKTLLATASLERINVDYFERQTGFVLWIVPSDSIYRQTWKALANREHPYRQMLERASGGRVKLLEKTDHFTPQDVDSQLCVMLLMLQSSARKSKESLRLFRDSGKFTPFFPDVDDYMGNNKLLCRVPNLHTNDLGDGVGVYQGVSVKHSLGNALKLVRPVMVIDEGHRAYSETARRTLSGFNPRFILELTATPNQRKTRESNVLVDIPGTALKAEQMIKLPIEAVNVSNADWKYILTESHARLEELNEATGDLFAADGRYIRPIMLIRADRTGKDQRDGAHVHAEDVREYLQDHLGVKPEAIRVKSATMDEIGVEDLFSKYSEVRYIITKDALREGWDCSFAYVLTILSKTTAPTALTQMIGRILRQPDARETSIESLNKCYVYCFDQDVNKVVDGIKKGLEEEGMGELADEVHASNGKDADEAKPVTIHRGKLFKGLKILLPRILHSNGNGSYRPIEYQRDILGELDWDQFSYVNKDALTADARNKLKKTITSIDMKADKGQMGFDFSKPATREASREGELDFSFMVRQMMEVVPNPWQASRIVQETLDAITATGKLTGGQLYASRLYILQEIKRDIQKQVQAESEKMFRQKLSAGAIQFKLMASGHKSLNWELAETLTLRVKDTDRIFRKKSAENLERSLFEKVYQKELNNLEQEVAWYLDGHNAVKWWHRLVVKQDYHLQGWQRNRVYPDFLACVEKHDDGSVQFTVLETKGEHLKGNDDTAYKERLFELLTEHYNTALEAGEIEVPDAEGNQMLFKMLMEDSWRPNACRILQS